MAELISPYGGSLSQLMASEEEARALKEQAVNFRDIHLLPSEEYDLELILNGAFSPLTGFMTRKEYETVLKEMRLPSGHLWPIPVTLGISKETAYSIKEGDKVALRDQEGFMLAVMEVEDIWEPDKPFEAKAVFHTADMHSHPGVMQLFKEKADIYIGGRVKGISLPTHYDYRALRQSPLEMRRWFKKVGWRRVIAFQTRRPLHNGHKEMTLNAAATEKAHILLHPIVGPTSPGDIEHYARIRCYKAMLEGYPPETATLNLLPFAMRMAGPKETLLHAIVNRNYGCSHMIVTPHHADPFNAAPKRPPYYPYNASYELLKQYEGAIGVKALAFERIYFVEGLGRFFTKEAIPEGVEAKPLSATELRERLEMGIDVPHFFSSKRLLDELKRAYPPRHEQGFTIFFTGLSGAGKSTLAKMLFTKFLETGERPVTLLDGDIVRKHLSSELGFSKKHRHINIIRIGFVASEITKNGGIAICAPIAPYEEARQYNRELISRYGGYIEVYVATPLEVCMKRDRKGLYRLALSGKKRGITGIDDPYEAPVNPEITLDTTEMSADECVMEIMAYLKKAGYIRYFDA